jgi:hypothetical protein
MSKHKHPRRSRPGKKSGVFKARLLLELLESRDLPSMMQPDHDAFSPNGSGTELSTSGPTGTLPAQIRHAYGFDQISFNGGAVPADGSGTTIAIVDAYDDPNIANDLHAFDKALGIPDPPTFTKVNQTGGSSPLPAPNSGWITEIALDVEWSHAIAPGANILLVEANDNSGTNLFAAVAYAADQPGVVAVSMSWGGAEFSGEQSIDNTVFQTPVGHAGVTFVASSGDSGAPPGYPATSPNVLAVGGTTLNLDSSGNIIQETGWSGSGGGISSVEAQPAYQSGLVIHNGTKTVSAGGKRADPDVAYDANPATGVPVYDTFNNPVSAPWGQWGGTSIASPQWAALIAIADQGRALESLGPLDGASQTLPTLYSLSAAAFNDITTGTSTGSPNYTAAPGFDLVTGRGTPIANQIVVDLDTHLAITGPADATAGIGFSVTVTVLDNSNNGQTGYTGTIQLNSSDSRAVLPAAATVTDGVGVISVTLKTAGGQTLAAIDTSVSAVQGSTIITVFPATAADFTISVPAATTVAEPLVFTVTAYDQFNNLATLYSGSVHFESSDTAATLPSDSTLTAGVGIFSATLQTQGSQTLTATDSIISSVTSASRSIVVTYPASHLLVSSPIIATAGNSFKLTVTAQDLFNDTVLAYGGTVHFTSNDTQSVLPPNSTLISGVGTFSVTLKTAGSATLTVTDSVLSSITGTSTEITVSIAALSRFSISVPTGITAGTPFSFTVTAEDPFNNIGTGYTGDVSFRSSDSSAKLPTFGTLTSGVGTFSATFETVGSQTLTAEGVTPGGPAFIAAPGVLYLTTAFAAGNFTNDGKLDLVGNDGFNARGPMTVYLNTGNGTFTVGSSINTGYHPSVMITGDFNGDGNQDLAFNSGNSIGVLLGNGNGTFGPVASYQVGSDPGLMAVGDFNGDGKQDLAVINANSTLSILMANPNGLFGTTFLPATTIALGNGATDVAVGDFNHDGKLDLVVTNTNDNDVEVFLGNGNGTFGPGATFGAGLAPSQIAVGDFTGDGNLDLAVNNPSTNAISVLLGNGDGTFGNPQSYTAGVYPGAPAAVDLNGDGIPDLIFPNPNANTLGMLLGNGDGTFVPGPFIPTSTYGVSNLVVGDMNGDGFPDVALHAGGGISVLLNQPLAGNATVAVSQEASAPATHFVVSAPTSATAGAGFRITITAEDSSNNTATGYDGTVQFASTDAQSVLPFDATLNNGVGTFSVTLKTAGNQMLSAADTATASLSGMSGAITVSPFAATHFAVMVPPAGVSAGVPFTFAVMAEDPFDNTATGYSGDVQFHSNDKLAVLPGIGPLTSGMGVFSATLVTLGSQSLSVEGVPADSTTFLPASGSPFGLSTNALGGGYFGNGAFDLVGTSASSESTTVYLNAGDGTFAGSSLNIGYNPSVVITGDFNGDGKQDLAVDGGNTVGVLLGNGNGTFGPIASYQVGSDPGLMAVGDFNGDGKQDLAVINANANTLSILLANPNGLFGTTFLPATTIALGNGATDVAVGNLNHDGKLDLVVTNTNDNDVEVFLGNGTGTFGPGATFAAGQAPSQIAIGDFTGAGNLDLAVNNPSTNAITVLLGNGNGTFGNSQPYVAGIDPGAPAAVDLNGDGIPDLIFPNTNTVGVLLGSGDGTFVPGPYIPASIYSVSSLVVGDMNGDGFPDIALDAGGINVLLNQPLTGIVSVPVGPAAASHFLVTTPSNAAGGSGFKFTITALDPFNDVATGYTGVVHFSSSDAAAVLQSDSSLVSGVGTFSATLNTRGSQTLVANDSVTSSITGASSTISVTGPASHFQVSSPASTIAGSPLMFAVTAQDSFNDTVVVYAGTVTFTSSDSQAVLPANATLIDGMGTFFATLKTAGSETLTATASGAASMTGASNTISVTAGAVTHFNIGIPAHPRAGAGFSFTVTAQDQFNNTGTSFNSSVQFSSSDSRAVLPLNATLTNGVGEFSATLSTAGSQTLIVDNPTISINLAQAPGSPVAIPWRPTDVALGNFNNDGTPDLAIANTNSTVSILIGAGNGGFQVGGTYPVGAYPNSIAVGDFNNDGKQDLALSTQNSNSVSVLLGNGNGTFGPTTQYQVGREPTAIAEGDFNGDGIPDLVVADYFGTLNLLFGNGNGTFGPATTISVGGNPTGIIAADFNHDGKLDLALVYNLSDEISVLLGNGNGTFGTATTYTVPEYAGGLVAGDFTGDGTLDLATTNPYLNSVSVLLGNGNGTFGMATTFGTNQSPGTAIQSSFGLADFNGDGKLDLVVGNTNNETVTVLLGNGNGTFGNPVSVAASAPNSLVVADLNGDGRPDVAFTNYFSNTVSILLNNPVPGGMTTVSVSPAAASHFAVEAPSVAIVGSGSNFTVTALDPFNNTSSTYTGTVDFTSSDSAAVLPAGNLLTSGIGTFSATFQTIGSQTLTAVDSLSTSITGASNAIALTGPATHFQLISAASATAGSAFGFTVTALDTFNDTVSAYHGTVLFTASDSRAMLPSAQTLTNGVGVFSVNLATAGSQTITATDTTAGSVTGEVTVNVTGAPATSLVVSTNTVSVQPGKVAVFTVTAVDPYGNTDTHYAGTVQFTSSDTAALLPVASTLTSGVGTFSATLYTIGLQTISAGVPVNVVNDGSFEVPALAVAAVEYDPFGTPWTYDGGPGNGSGLASNGSGIMSGNPNAPGGTQFGFLQEYGTISQPVNLSAGSYYVTFEAAQRGSFSNHQELEIAMDGVAVGTTTPSSTNYATFRTPIFTVASSGIHTLMFAGLDPLGGDNTAFLDLVSIVSVATSSTISVSNTTAHFGISAPTDVAANSAFTFTIMALDQHNFVAPGYTGTVHFSSSDSLALLPADASLSNGVGTFSATFQTVGNQVISATDITVSSITGASDTIIAFAVPTEIQVTAPSTATAGSTFGVTVTALVGANDPSSYYTGTVNFTSSDSQAVLPANGSLTNGVGTFSVTLKRAGNQTLAVAAATGLPGQQVSGSTVVLVSAAALSHLQLTAPSSVIAGSAASLTLSALDPFNNIATSFNGIVQLTSSDKQAVLPAVVTLASGVGTVTATLTTAGSQTLTAIDQNSGGNGGTISASATIVVGAAGTTHFAVLDSSGALLANPIVFTVSAQDQFNNTASSYSGTVMFSSTDSAAILPANSSLISGQGTFAATLNTLGTQTLIATDTKSTSITGFGNAILVSPVPASHFVVSAGPNTMTAGGTVTLTVTAEDPSNHLASAYNGTVHFASSDTRAVLPANATLTTGIGVFSATLFTAGRQTVTATDTVNSSLTGYSNPITVSAAALTHFVLTVPSSVVAGSAFGFTVAAEDQFNNAASTYSGTVTFSTSDTNANIKLPANAPLINGVGKFTATLATVGNQILYATDTVASTLTAFSSPILVNTAPATHLRLTSQTWTTAGSAFNLTVIALDQFNNTATGYLGVVQFTTTDTNSQHQVPAPYSFVATDNGQHVFINDVTLVTSATTQTVTGANEFNSSITAGTTSLITVAPLSANHFLVAAPLNATAGSPFGVTVTALDRFGNNVPSYTGTVTLSATGDTAASFGPASNTLTSGVGVFSATLFIATPARTLSIAAPGLLSATITLAVSAATASQFSVIAPATAVEGSAFRVTVNAIDPYGNLDTTYSNIVSLYDSLTNAGFAKTLTGGTGVITVTLDTPGSRTLTATDTNISGVSNTISITAANHFVVSASPQQTAGSPFAFTVVAKDGTGNIDTIYGGTVAFFSTDSTATFLPADSVLTSGIGVFEATLRVAESQMLNASDGTISGTSAPIRVSSAPASHFVLSVPATVTAGAGFQVAVTAEDPFNNIATGYGGTVMISSSDSAEGLAVSGTLASGVGTFTATLKTAGSATLAATDSVTNSVTGISPAVIVSSDAATHLVVSAPSAATAGTSFRFTVIAEDEFNNTAPGYMGTVTFASNDSAAVLPPASTLQAGVGSFNATLETAGQWMLMASDSSLGTPSAASNAVLVTGGAATHFVVGAPAAVTAGSLFHFTVTAQDVFNNTAPDYAGTVTFTSGDSLATPAAAGTLSGGIGTFQAVLDTAGSQTLIARDMLFATITGSSTAITVGAATATHFVLRGASMARAGTATPFTLAAEDRFNNAATGYGGMVTFASSDTGAILPPAAAVAAGVGTFSATLVTAGSQTLMATDLSDSTINGGSNAIDVGPAAATHFAVASPANANAAIGFKFTVQALDAFNNAATGYAGTVKFSSSDSAAILPSPSPLMEGVGTFSATLVALGSQAVGVSDIVSSTIAGASNTITVGQPPATHFALSPATSSNTAGNSFEFTVTALDQFNHTATDYSGLVEFTSSDNAATLPAEDQLTSGIGEFSTTLFTAGSQDLTAKDTVSSNIAGSIYIGVNAGPATQFAIAAPPNAVAGDAFSITVTAQDQYGNTATGYTGTVDFATSDDGLGASVPADSTLLSGVGTFSATLVTAGTQTLTATDSQNTDITASATVIVPVTLFIPNATAVQNSTVTVPINVTGLNDPNSPFQQSGLSGGTFVLVYNPNVFSLPDDGVQLGTLPDDPSYSTANNWQVTSTTPQPGVAVINLQAPSSSYLVSTGGGTLVTVNFQVLANAPLGPSTIDLAADEFGPQTMPATAIYDGVDSIDAFQPYNLIPAPQDNTTLIPYSYSGSDPDDGTITITSASLPPLAVTNFTPTPTGFTVTFNRAINPSTLNLYTTGSVPDDVMLSTALTQVSVRGSVIFNSTDTALTFVKTDSVSSAGTFNPANGLLAAGNYTVTLRSFTPGGSGFEDLLGNALNSTGTGALGSSFVATFSVSSPSVAVGIPDFARGFSNTDALYFASGANGLVNGGTFTLSYTNPEASPATGAATITFSTDSATLRNNIQAALTSGGLAVQIGTDPASDTPNSVVVVTNDSATGANVLVTFQNALALATDELLSSSTPGVSIAPATMNVANNIPGDGIPLALSNGRGVTSGSFTLQYNPSVLTISGAVSKIAGASFTLVANNTITGVAVLSFSSPATISTLATPITLGSLLAAVPLSATASYGAVQLLYFSSEQLNGTAGSIAITGADAVQVAAYFGDVTDTGGPLSLSDASAIFATARAIPNMMAQTIPGFAAFPDLDPAIMGDVALEGSVTSADAGGMLQEVGGMARITIPYAPMGLLVAPPMVEAVALTNGGGTSGESPPSSAGVVKASALKRATPSGHQPQETGPENSAVGLSTGFAPQVINQTVPLETLSSTSVQGTAAQNLATLAVLQAEAAGYNKVHGAWPSVAMDTLDDQMIGLDDTDLAAIEAFFAQSAVKDRRWA